MQYGAELGETMELQTAIRYCACPRWVKLRRTQWEHVFRFAPESGHRAMQSVCPKGVESRCDAVALGSNISVSAPFVRRCLTGSTMAPLSHLPGRRRRSPAPGSHRTWRADFPHPALRQLVHSFHCYLFKRSVDRPVG